MTKKLNRDDLELAAAITEEGSVTRAALRLHLSQPAVSHHLRSLEDRLGGRLFRRGKQRMTPTPLGEELAERGRRICAEFRESEEALDRVLHGKQRIVRLGTECYTSYQWLPAVVQELARRNENLELRVVIEATHRAKAALAAREVDVVILQSAGEERGLAYWPLFRDELVLLVSSRHPLAKRKVVEATDFAGQTLLLHSMPGRTLGVIDEFFVPARAYPAQLRRVQLTEAIIEMVRAEMGVTILARWLAEPYTRSKGLSLIRLGKGLWREWRLAALQERSGAQEMEALSRALSAIVRKKVSYAKPNLRGSRFGANGRRDEFRKLDRLRSQG
jgi:LysR family transcriptional regulator for metE and metH